MSKTGILPLWLSKLHPKYQTPYRAILFCGAISTFSCLLGEGALSWFVNASSFSVVLMYGMDVLAFITLRRKQPVFFPFCCSFPSTPYAI